LVHPASIRPEEFLRFVELDPFPQLWSKLKLDDVCLQALQIGIMAGPTKHPVVRGSHGIRKLRFSKPGSNSGKSGGYRVYYVYFQEYGIVLLMAVIAKNEQAGLTKADLNILAPIVDRAKSLPDKGAIR